LFQVVDLPDIGQPASVLTDLAATARQVACEIARRQPSGSILIAGFSFGGTVAFEAASHLISEGREIRFLGLLDAVVDVPMFGALPGRKNLPRTLPSRAQNKCLVLTLRLLTAWLGGRRLVLAALRRLSLNAFIRLRNHILWDCRLRALRGWHARSPTTSANGMRVLLAVSEEFAPAAIAVWQQLCPGMIVVQLPGGHLDVLRTSSLPKLAPAFEDLILRDEV
jgi:thioesterase domain-containing protein